MSSLTSVSILMTKPCPIPQSPHHFELLLLFIKKLTAQHASYSLPVPHLCQLSDSNTL